jgi:ribosomal protein S18 acetylase RimI-like enzyme
MSGILTDLSAPAVTEAIEANMFDFFPLVGALPRAEVHDSSEILWSLTDLPLYLFNSVLRARLAPENVDAEIEAAIARCQSRKVPIWWWTGPSTRPADLGVLLERHGFAFDSEAPGMAADISQLNENQHLPSDVRIVQAVTEADLAAWNHARTVGYGSSALSESAWRDLCLIVGFGEGRPLRCFTAFRNDEPEAAAMPFLAAGVAGVYNVATVPEVRRQGFGGAVTLAALRQARLEGYCASILLASEEGESIYRRLGFHEYCKIGEYTWTPNRDT